MTVTVTVFLKSDCTHVGWLTKLKNKYQATVGFIRYIS